MFPTKPDTMPDIVTLKTESTGTGPDVVILHGLFGSGENWRSQAKRLSTDFTVHCMDLRNHGASPHASAMNYPAMAADVIQTCQHLNIKSCHLIGHSMGGKTAMQLALTTPALIEQLIIVDIGPKLYPHHHGNILEGLSKLQQASANGLLNSRREADNLLTAFVENSATRSFLLKNLERTASGQYRLAINLDAIVNNYDDIAAAITPLNSHPRDRPTLFIKGAESDYLQANDQPGIIALFPGAKLKSIGGAGHWPQSEKPDVVYKIIYDFLTDQQVAQ